MHPPPGRRGLQPHWVVLVEGHGAGERCGHGGRRSGGRTGWESARMCADRESFRVTLFGVMFFDLFSRTAWVGRVQVVLV